MFQCSECKHTFTQEFLEGWGEYTYESLFPPFCPNCGANMKGEPMSDLISRQAAIDVVEEMQTPIMRTT